MRHHNRCLRPTRPRCASGRGQENLRRRLLLYFRRWVNLQIMPVVLGTGVLDGDETNKFAKSTGSINGAKCLALRSYALRNVLIRRRRVFERTYGVFQHRSTALDAFKMGRGRGREYLRSISSVRLRAYITGGVNANQDIAH